MFTLFGFRDRQRIKEHTYDAIGRFDTSKMIVSRLINSPEESCCVCLSRLKGRDDISVLPCLHEFHRECINRWFNVCRKTCPICRLSMEGEEKVRLTREELTEEMVIWFSSFHVGGFWVLRLSLIEVGRWLRIFLIFTRSWKKSLCFSNFFFTFFVFLE